MCVAFWIDRLILPSAAAYHKRGTSFTQHDTDTPPASEKAIDDVNSGHGMPEITEDPEPPAEYEERDYDWFKSGRLFRIFAPRDVEIHEKQFCLLDTEGNKEGPGLLLHRHSSQVGKGSFLRRHVALKDYVDPEKRDHDAKLKVVYLDAYEEQQVPPDTWIELEHIYNIPFTKYRCTDCGILDRSSLQDLRQYFIDWLRYHWSLG